MSEPLKPISDRHVAPSILFDQVAACRDAAGITWLCHNPTGDEWVPLKQIEEGGLWLSAFDFCYDQNRERSHE